MATPYPTPEPDPDSEPLPESEEIRPTEAEPEPEGAAFAHPEAGPVPETDAGHEWVDETIEPETVIEAALDDEGPAVQEQPEAMPEEAAETPGWTGPTSEEEDWMAVDPSDLVGQEEPDSDLKAEPSALDSSVMGPGYQILEEKRLEAAQDHGEMPGEPPIPPGPGAYSPGPRPTEATPPPGASQVPPPTPPMPALPLSASDERTWAMIAHLSILANLFTGFLGPVIPLVIYLVYKDRSRYLAFQSLQAFVFQLVAWVGAGILATIAWTISGVLVAAFFIGCLLMPLALIITVIPIAALIYGVIGAVQANQGQDFRYWLIGDWVRSLQSSS